MNIDDGDKKIKRVLLFSLTSLLIGILIPILAITLPWKPECEPLNTWFQRSGSLMVIIAVWAEVKLSGIYSMLHPTGFVHKGGDVYSKRYKFRYNIIVTLVGLLAIAGTLIWGYGDLIIGNT